MIKEMQIDPYKAKALQMRFKQIAYPHANLPVPESWDNVQSFADWWMEQGMPICFPSFPEVFLSDDATAVCLFRKGQFQVELYLIHPQPIVPLHEHPGVEVIKMRLGNRDIPLMSEVLTDGHAHGAEIRMEAEEVGYPLIAFQHWSNREPTTVAAMWKGYTVGPKQEALIRRFNPDAFIVPGYADITRSKDDPNKEIPPKQSFKR